MTSLTGKGPPNARADDPTSINSTKSAGTAARSHTGLLGSSGASLLAADLLALAYFPEDLVSDSCLASV